MSKYNKYQSKVKAKYLKISDKELQNLQFVFHNNFDASSPFYLLFLALMISANVTAAYGESENYISTDSTNTPHEPQNLALHPEINDITVSNNDGLCYYNNNDMRVFNQNMIHPGIYQLPEHTLSYDELEQYYNGLIADGILPTNPDVEEARLAVRDFIKYKLGAITTLPVSMGADLERETFKKANEYFYKELLQSPEDVIGKFKELATMLANEEDLSKNIGVEILIRRVSEDVPGFYSPEKFKDYLQGEKHSTKNLKTYNDLQKLFSNIWGDNLLDNPDIWKGFVGAVLQDDENNLPTKVKKFVKKYYTISVMQDLDEILTDIFSKYDESITDPYYSIHMAADAHMQIIEGHCLPDGNGRLARFITQYFMDKVDCTILYTNDSIYTKAVQKSLVKGNSFAFSQYLTNQMAMINEAIKKGFSPKKALADLEDCVYLSETPEEFVENCITLIGSMEIGF